MIILADMYLKSVIEEKLKHLIDNTSVLYKIFDTISTRNNLANLHKYFIANSFPVIMGFPRETQKLPCFVILLSGEQESSIGLGDNIDDYENDYTEDDGDMHTHVISAVYMNSSYRIECWSDNGDTTVYMYALLKWCLLAARTQMIRDGFMLPKVSGTDLEPIQDYIPNAFVMRRALIIGFNTENKYFDSEVKIGDDVDHLPVGTTIDDIKVSPNSYNSDIE